MIEIWCYKVQLSPPSLTPNFFNILSIKHHLVKLDWMRLIATKPVNRKKYGFIKYPSVKESKTKLPAISFIESLIVI